MKKETRALFIQLIILAAVLIVIGPFMMFLSPSVQEATIPYPRGECDCYYNNYGFWNWSAEHYSLEPQLNDSQWIPCVSSNEAYFINLKITIFCILFAAAICVLYHLFIRKTNFEQIMLRIWNSRTFNYAGILMDVILFFAVGGLFTVCSFSLWTEFIKRFIELNYIEIIIGAGLGICIPLFGMGMVLLIIWHFRQMLKQIKIKNRMARKK